MSLRFAKARVLSAECRSIAKWPRLLGALLLVLLAVPSNAFAQRDAFFSALVNFYKTLAGVYGDEGPQLVAQVVAISTALQRWDEEIRAAETQLRSESNGRSAFSGESFHLESAWNVLCRVKLSGLIFDSHPPTRKASARSRAMAR